MQKSPFSHQKNNNRRHKSAGEDVLFFFLVHNQCMGAVFLLAELGGSDGKTLLEIAGKDDVGGVAAGCGDLVDAHLGMLDEELGAVNQPHLIDKSGQRRLLATLREGGTDTLFGQM